VDAKRAGDVGPRMTRAKMLQSRAVRSAVSPFLVAVVTISMAGRARAKLADLDLGSAV